MARYRFPVANHKSAASLRARGVHAPRSADLYKSDLEMKYPNILTAIQSMWGYKELNTYFTKLTMDDRGGRAGFPKEIWEEIHLLLKLHQEIVPEPLFKGNPSRHALDF
ncbi:MAG: hypothetical protein ACXWJD_08370, partial [Burkholderiaceae bacterium]